MIFDVTVHPSYWLTLVVRAPNAERAHEIALKAAQDYGDDLTVEVEAIDPNGPEGVLLEDAS